MLIVFTVCICFGGCALLFTTKGFKAEDQRFLFCKDYNPDINNTLKTGIYLLYDQASSKFLKGYGFILFPDGCVNSTYLDLDFLKLEDATPQNIERLLDTGFLSCHSFFGDGIYFVNGDKLCHDLYYVDIKHWELRKVNYSIIDDLTVTSDTDDLEPGEEPFIYRCIPIPVPDIYKYQESKNQKWLWCNKKDWQNFKDERKIIEYEAL